MSTLVLLTGLALSACGDDKPDGPTVAQADKALHAHIDELVGVGVGNVRNLKITDPGGKDIPCGEGKAKRTYAVSGDKRDPKRDDLSLTPVELSNSMFGRLTTHVAKYELKQFSGGDPKKVMSNAETRTNLTFVVPAKGVIEIYGSTDCLRSG
ncbi:hypothetical protein [Actinomadura rudentiformis]|uniref:Uncharacterized protein n=1 Tax=Actinomadura rudentiformis TaxID=359158 RepID=A0A6H9YRD9_9ACTN|nr:hypothetical protein [Actinomadura rudentiformis]KAB2344313.1 hypothetical protein F8566_30665 [Actinomadura rudentiformis]